MKFSITKFAFVFENLTIDGEVRKRVYLPVWQVIKLGWYGLCLSFMSLLTGRKIKSIHKDLTWMQEQEKHIKDRK